MKKIVMLMALATTIYACKSNTETKVEVKASFNVDSAKKEIQAHHLAFETAVSKADTVSFANLFTTDAKRLGPNAPIQVGRQAIISNTVLAMNVVGSAKLTLGDVWGDENSVTEEGNYQLNKKDGTVLEKGKYIAIYKRVEGKLLIYRDIWNSDAPAAPAAPTK